MDAAHQFYTLTLKEVISLSSDTVKLVFVIPQAIKEQFSYLAGQYVTLRFVLNGQEERRAYSLCSSPALDQDLAVAVKRVPNGLVSNHINDQLKAEDQIEVMPAEGHFVAQPQADEKKDYFLFGGGSGLTPLLSILKSVIELAPKSRVFLYYQNRTEDSILFREELDRLEKRYAGQLLVQHILSQPKTETSGGFMGLFAKKNRSWKGEMGRIDAKKASRFIKQHQAEDGRPKVLYLCGPVGLMDAAQKAGENLGIDQIHREWFNADEAPRNEVNAQANAKVYARIDGEDFEVVLQKKESILDGLRRVGADAPFSCMSGACSSCMAKVEEGSVEMERCLALDEEEVAQGFILSCQSKPTTPIVRINFDV